MVVEVWQAQVQTWKAVKAEPASLVLRRKFVGVHPSPTQTMLRSVMMMRRRRRKMTLLQCPWGTKTL
jgi:hypothetical protein